MVFFWLKRRWLMYVKLGPRLRIFYASLRILCFELARLQLQVENDANKKAIGQYGAIPFLIRMVEHGSAKEQEVAAGALANLIQVRLDVSTANFAGYCRLLLVSAPLSRKLLCAFGCCGWLEERAFALSLKGYTVPTFKISNNIVRSVLSAGRQKPFGPISKSRFSAFPMMFESKKGVKLLRTIFTYVQASHDHFFSDLYRTKTSD